MHTVSLLLACFRGMLWKELKPCLWFYFYLLINLFFVDSSNVSPNSSMLNKSPSPQCGIKVDTLQNQGHSTSQYNAVCVLLSIDFSGLSHAKPKPVFPWPYRSYTHTQTQASTLCPYEPYTHANYMPHSHALMSLHMHTHKHMYTFWILWCKV